MENFNARRIARIGVVAALYVALTLSLSFLAYRDIQFRIAEALMLLCFFDKDYIIALTFGCFIANLFSPMAIDMLVGTSATLVAAIPMYLLRKPGSVKRMLLCSLFPVISNGFIVAAELKLAFGSPYWLSVGTVALGEFVCVTVAGVILFSQLSKNKAFMSMITGGDKQVKA
ncbi:MAG: QueT transporter family protein [Ruminococcus sp.]|nr:QueT transporter family protein [Ruminococcus sp.]